MIWWLRDAAGLLAVGLLTVSSASAQQRADLDFRYVIEHPAYAESSGPSVAIDAGHHNFHTADGRFAPFAKLVASDGFQVRSLNGGFSQGIAPDVDILVIANALHADNERHWSLPTPSAFSEDEITKLRDWVEQGGSLLLIADHMPFAGAAQELAQIFGFTLVNGYAAKVEGGAMTLTFSPGNGLDLTPIGDHDLPPTGHVVTFTGQAFTIPAGARSVLTLQGRHIALMPAVAGKFSRDTPFEEVTGYSQGAVLDYGAGRVAIFGEAAAFTAQTTGSGKRMGMNAPGAEDNAPFVLKVMRWLARL